MEKGFLDKVKDNVVVRVWSEKTQQEKGDSLTKGFVAHRRRVYNSAPLPEDPS
ncbi:hypothetical protein Goari_002747 [Gossypium aridum]|uniref:Uncharacterized protein n=1 Tax=Gossypium aridum TaxID=34290 RepID=A0A7J8Y9E4_GOSAI|nr:hypothetical protein [Gossypium aridum]